MNGSATGTDTLVGQRLGPPGHQYEILDLLGRGGMGPVYRAQQLNLPRQVAVKVIDPRLVDDAGFVARFHREAQAIASLEHAHILPVYDFGAHEGLLYLVMRLVRGGTVKDRFVAEGSLPWPAERVLHLSQQVLPALEHAHRAGVVHRDVKPANILLEEEWAYLADFGIAKLATSADAAPGLTLTGTGMMVGTPNYMAPEQVRGQPLDGRADLYAFGVVVYELLTGHVPFHGDTPLDVAIQQLQAPLPPARTVNPDLPAMVEDVLVRALAKDRDERYPDGSAFLAALSSATQATNATANVPTTQPTLIDRGGQPARAMPAPLPPPAATVASPTLVPAATYVAGPAPALATQAPAATVAGAMPGPAAARAAATVSGMAPASEAAPGASPAAATMPGIVPAADAARAGQARGVPAAGITWARWLRAVLYYAALWVIFGSLFAAGAVAHGVYLAGAPAPDGFAVALRTLALVGGIGVATGLIRRAAGSPWGGVLWSLAALGAVAVGIGLAAAPTLERLVLALRATAGAALAAGQTPEGRRAALRIVALAGGAGVVGGLLRLTVARSVWGGLFWAIYWAALAAFLAAGPGGGTPDAVSRAAVLGAVGGLLGSAAGRLWVPRD